MEALPLARPLQRPQLEQEHGQAEATEPLSPVQSGSGVSSGEGDRTIAELAQQYDIHQNQITGWKCQLLDRAAQVFGDRSSPSQEPDLTALHVKIGRLALENDFLESALTKAGLLSARK